MLWVALVLRDSFGDSGLEFGLGFYGWIRIKSQNLLKIIRTYPRSPKEGVKKMTVLLQNFMKIVLVLKRIENLTLIEF